MDGASIKERFSSAVLKVILLSTVEMEDPGRLVKGTFILSGRLWSKTELWSEFTDSGGDFCIEDVCKTGLVEMRGRLSSVGTSNFMSLRI